MALECDTWLYSNGFAPLLAAAAGSLRTLDLCLGEELNATAVAALHSLNGLTSLSLRFADPVHFVPGWAEEAGDDEWAAPPKHTLDCRLLGSLTALQVLSLPHASDCKRLAHPQALARLPALCTLRLPCGGGLPTLAPHLPQLTCLELEHSSASRLEEDHGACAALRSLPALQRLVLGGHEYVSPQHGIAAAHVRLNDALATVAGCLPRGCHLQTAPVMYIGTDRRWYGPLPAPPAHQ